MGSPNLSLKESIEQAANDQANPKSESELKTSGETSKNDSQGSSSEEKEGKSDTPTDSKEGEEGKKEDRSKDFVADDELANAVNLLRALNDPDQQTQVITELARRAGILPESKDLTAKQEQSYKDILQEALAEEYPDLKDKLGKVFDAINSTHKREVDELRAEIQRDKQQAAQQEFSVQYDSFIKMHSVTETQAAEMIELIQQMPPNPNARTKISLPDYLSKIHKLVGGQKAVRDASDSDTKRIEQNARREENLSRRGTQASSDVGDDRIKKGSKLPSLKEAIMAASNGEILE